MDKIIEDAEILTFGKRSFDVSNVPMGRKKIARRTWDNMVADYTKELSEAEKEEDKLNIQKLYGVIMNDLYDTLGLYLIRQQTIVLNRRFSFIKSKIDFIRRYLLTIKHIYKSSEEEYTAFQDWASYTITGVKKKEMETTKLIQDMERAAIEELQKVYPDPDQLMAVYQTLVRETVGNMNISAPSQKVS